MKINLAKLLGSAFRAVVKVGTFGAANPVFEAIKNIKHNQKKAGQLPGTTAEPEPHTWASIIIQIGMALYVFLGTETGRGIVKAILKKLGLG